MLRSQTVNTIQDLNAQGKSVQDIAQELQISRTTVRKYVKHPEAVISKQRLVSVVPLTNYAIISVPAVRWEKWSRSRNNGRLFSRGLPLSRQ